MTKAEAIQRYRAVIKLRQLYQAHMATEYGNAILALRLESQVAADDSLDPTDKTLRLQELARLRSLTKERYLAFSERAGQLDTRVSELAEWTE